MLKRELRSVYRKKRDELPEELISRYSNQIGVLLLGWLKQHPEINCLHTFLPARGKKEIDTFSILNYCSGHLPPLKFVVPKIGNEARTMTHHLWEAGTPLIMNRWGIPEPDGQPEFDLDRIDAVLVPMLIFDRNGHRVGYGGGYYDTFLAALPREVPKIGLCIFDPVPAIGDVNSFDIPLDLCITPGEIHRFGGVQ